MADSGFWAVQPPPALGVTQSAVMIPACTELLPPRLGPTPAAAFEETGEEKQQMGMLSAYVSQIN